MNSYLAEYTMKFFVVLASANTYMQQLWTNFLHVNRILNLNILSSYVCDLKSSLWKEIIV